MVHLSLCLPILRESSIRLLYRLLLIFFRYRSLPSCMVMAPPAICFRIPSLMKPSKDPQDNDDDDMPALEWPEGASPLSD